VKEIRGQMKILLIFGLCICLELVSPLIIGISNHENIGHVAMFRQGVALPDWHQLRTMEPLSPPLSSNEVGETALVIDTQGAFVDSISLTLLLRSGGNSRTSSSSEVLVMIYDDNVCIWNESLQLPTSTMEPYVHHMDLLDLIRAPAADRVKLIDTFTYNGDFVALWRVKHLFDLVDEFIIAEAAYTHSGLKKESIFFLEPQNVALFAPYMSKITYVVVRDCPPPPPHWPALMLGHMGSWDEEQEGFWRENYQKLFCRFFVRPPSTGGKKSLVFVSDADEVLNADTMRGVMLAEDALPPGDSSSLFAAGSVIHPQMYCFYYNFDTVSMNAWELPYLVSSERYESMRDTLFLRVVRGEEAVLLPAGGWHLTYFISYPGFLRKLANIAHLTVPKTLPCEHIRDSIAHSTDLFGRRQVPLAPRAALVVDTLPAALLPAWWRELQEEVLALQRDSCECCSSPPPAPPATL
jgi:hypothetical protein